MTYQGSPPPRSARTYERDLRYPPPAEMAPPARPRGSGGPARPRGGSAWFWSGIGLAAAGAAVVAFALLHGGAKPVASTQPGTLVTTFLPGELKRVPASCAAVTAAILDQYLPGRSKPVAAQPLEGTAASQCSWSVDKPQRYRFMEVAVEAYGPSGLASGNGSATQAARDAFVQARVAKLFPPPKSHEPKATVTAVKGLGQEAFSAAQRYQRGGTLDMVTLVARYRNVVVTVVFEARTSRSGPDPFGVLRTGATAAAQAVLARLG